MLCCAGNAEETRDAANPQDQRVIRQLTLGQDEFAVGVVHSGDRHHLVQPIEVEHFALPEFEMMPTRLRDVVELVRMRINAAGGDLMQQRLPQVRRFLVDQRDLRPARLAELVAQARR